MDPIYLDNAATTPLAPEVRDAMRPWLEGTFGNPSSRHAFGARAAEAVDLARRRIARALGARARDVVFTSGGTEANNLAVLGFPRARRREGDHVLVGPTEHASVRRAAQALAGEGFAIEETRLGPEGGLDLDDLTARLRTDTVLVALMLVNNEFGTVHPVREVARLVRRRSPRAVLHVDAIQATGKLELSLLGLGADSLSISGHKVHGPMGAGALVLREGLAPPRPLLYGGGQEAGLRSGTENVAGAVGLGRAIELADDRLAETRAALAAARAALRDTLGDVPGARLLEPGGPDCVSAAIAAVLLSGPPAEVYLHHLEARGVLTSVGSACHGRRSGISPALRALGLSEDEARRVLRLSFSHRTGEEEVRRAVAILAAVAQELGAG